MKWRWPARKLISRELLIQNKLSSGRLQDLADVEKLRALAAAVDFDSSDL
jgi:hypothetical protein